MRFRAVRLRVVDERTRFFCSLLGPGPGCCGACSCFCGSCHTLPRRCCRCRRCSLLAPGTRSRKTFLIFRGPGQEKKNRRSRRYGLCRAPCGVCGFRAGHWLASARFRPTRLAARSPHACFFFLERGDQCIRSVCVLSLPSTTPGSVRWPRCPRVSARRCCCHLPGRSSSISFWYCRGAGFGSCCRCCGPRALGPSKPKKTGSVQ